MSRTVEVKLDKGITVGDVVHNVAVLRTPTAADTINAMRKAEELVSVSTIEGGIEPQFIASPVMTGINLLLSQLVSIGPEFTAPFDEKIFEFLSPEDLNLLVNKIEEMKTAASREVAHMGRQYSERGDDQDTD